MEKFSSPYRFTNIDIDLDALDFNVKSIKSHIKDSEFMPVVKANAYGHGIVEISKYLVKHAHVKWLGVAILEEAILLRKAGIKVPILVFGGVFDSQIEHFLDYNLDIPVLSISKLKIIDEIAKKKGKKARIHLKIDTGMNRVGVSYLEAEKFFLETVKSKNCELIGVFSHFAKIGDKDDKGFSKLQLERFLKAVSFFKKNSLPIPIRHIASSSCVTRFVQSHLDLVRTGIALYGISPYEKCPLKLKPVMSLKTKVVLSKEIEEGEGVSYSHTWRALTKTRVATLPIGYGDGFFRALSNRGEVLIRSKRYKIIGNICMDQMMVSTENDKVEEGEDVILIGKQGDKEIKVEEISSLLKTNPHEVLSSITKRVSRTYIKEGKILEV